MDRDESSWVWSRKGKECASKAAFMALARGICPGWTHGWKFSPPDGSWEVPVDTSPWAKVFWEQHSLVSWSWKSSKRVLPWAPTFRIDPGGMESAEGQGRDERKWPQAGPGEV